jgi:sugar phosphate isomerase/epimerase
MHQNLPKSYKKAYPFRIGTTSYIYPDALCPNVARLAPYLDEIELLLFESHAPECLPSTRDIQSLKRIGADHDLTYNVHLPIDAVLNDGDPAVRRHASNVILHVFDLMEPLSPSTYTLHLPYTASCRKEADIARWRENTLSGMDTLMGRGMAGERISVETLDYDLAWADPVIEAFGLRVCIDIGHLIRYGFDVETTYRKYAAGTSVIHLHGVNNGKDHLALNALGEKEALKILDMLKEFKETLSLEVFSFEHLKASLLFLEKMLPK